MDEVEEVQVEEALQEVVEVEAVVGSLADVAGAEGGAWTKGRRRKLQVTKAAMHFIAC